MTGAEPLRAVVIVASTRAADGRYWHSSWWQEPQGAEQLGEKALRAADPMLPWM